MMTIEEINNYIQDKYKIDTTISINFTNLKQINFKNKNIDTPFCSIYLDICPEWGYAPSKMLIYYCKEKKNHTGSSGSVIYDGIKSIDDVMKNVFELNKED